MKQFVAPLAMHWGRRRPWLINKLVFCVLFRSDASGSIALSEKKLTTDLRCTYFSIVCYTCWHMNACGVCQRHVNEYFFIELGFASAVHISVSASTFNTTCWSFVWVHIEAPLQLNVPPCFNFFPLWACSQWTIVVWSPIFSAGYCF